MLKNISFTILFVISTFYVSASSYAAELLLTEQLLHCKSITESEPRLVCLDTILRSLALENKASNVQAESDETVVVLGEKGLKANHVKIRKSYSYSLIKAVKNKRKQWHFYFENGEVWQQNEAGYLPKPKMLPQNVTITEGVLGSYNLKTSYFANPVKVNQLK